MEDIHRVFVLLDHRGTGRVLFDSVVAFCGTLDPPPTNTVLRAVYDQFDDDGSGDIDETEFHGFCHALEQATATPMAAMAERFVNALHARLWSLVSPSGSSVTQQEMRVFLDSGASALAVTPPEIDRALRECPPLIDAGVFGRLVPPLMGSNSMAKVVFAFETADNNRRSAQSKATATFGERKRRDTVDRTSEDSRSGSPGLGRSTLAPSATVPIFSHVGESAPTLDFSHTMHDAAHDIFHEAFCLMDTRGGGVLSLDNVYEFCESLPMPPAPPQIRKIFNQFDEDGSGDIDPDEFLGFCRALEAAANMETKEMLTHFTRAMYLRLFELVDDSGDSNALVSRDEMKVLLDAIGPMLASKLSAQDVVRLLRGYPDELDFENFVLVVKQLTVGKNISHVVGAFEEAKRRRKANKHYAMQQFEERKRPVRSTSPLPEPEPEVEAPPFIDLEIAERDVQIQELTEELAQARSEGDALRQRALSTKSKLLDEHSKAEAHWAKERSALEAKVAAAEARARAAEELVQEQRRQASASEAYDPIALLQSVTDAVAAATGAPAASTAAYLRAPMRHVAGLRFNHVARTYAAHADGSATDVASTAAAVSEQLMAHHSALSQARALLQAAAPALDTFAGRVRELGETCVGGEASKPALRGVLTDRLRAVQGARRDAGVDAESLSIVVDRMLRARDETSTCCLAVAPFTSAPRALTDAAAALEAGSQRLADVAAIVAVMAAPCGLRSPAEFLATAIVEGALTTEPGADDIARIAAFAEACATRCVPSELQELLADLDATMQAAEAVVASSSGFRRDTAVQTLPEAELEVVPRRRAAAADEDEAADIVPTHTVNSTSPRIRTRREDHRSQQDKVDKALQRATRHIDVALPANFGRVEGSSNQFTFGTRKIELIPVSDVVCVKVGGGYLTFEEFCEKHAMLERRRVAASRGLYALTPRTTGTRSSTPGPATPRSGTTRSQTPSAGPKRTMTAAFTGRNFNLV